MLPAAPAVQPLLLFRAGWLLLVLLGLPPALCDTAAGGERDGGKPAGDGEPRAEERLSPADLEFFESRIRPVLAEQCYACHNSVREAESGLALDHRAALRAGGDGGPILVPGRPEASRLLRVLRHELDGLEMPPDGGKLSAAVVADFAEWIRRGAPDPRDRPPTAEQLTHDAAWEAEFARRKAWWSFQPLRAAAPPAPAAGEDSSLPEIDRFLRARLAAEGLEPNAEADRRTLARRLHFALLGLPPSPEEVEAFVEDEHPEAYERLVDRLLASEHFGERWARHWMDWVRYAESHGSEGDPAIAEAWRYRDYLIRALNADVPYDQLLREHVAGDLLPAPRLNRELGLNESALGTAHWRMVFHGFAPTDALEERVRFTDDQINAFTKGFLGLTVSCARCHHHKFDPISQHDYYALFGVLASNRPARTLIDLPEQLERHREELARLKLEIRAAAARDWQPAIAGLPERLRLEEELRKQAESPRSPLHDWREIVRAVEREGEGAFTAAWRGRKSVWEKERAEGEAHRAREYPRRWRLGELEDYRRWFPAGNGLGASPSPPGEFAVAVEGERALAGIFPAGAYSHGLSTKHAGRLTSPDIPLDGEYELHLRFLGEGSTARYVVQNYPRRGTVYPIAQAAPAWKQQKFNLAYWSGDTIHVELACGPDAPLELKEHPRSWFGLREVVLARPGEASPPGEIREWTGLLLAAAEESPPASPGELAELVRGVVSEAAAAWSAGRAGDAQAELLAACLEHGVLPNTLAALPAAAPLIAEYRRLEAELPVPRRVPGIEEAEGRDQPLFLRGDHRRAGAPVPRRFLSVIDPTPYRTERSGRLELAADLLRPENPLTRRVIVNRLWHHLFGAGLVATPDNFGRLGEEPSHGELLDWLALELEREGWSLKRMIRRIVTSRAWRQASTRSPAARERDPENRLLSHFPLRRLEAEGVRDNLLAVSGRLDRTLHGPPVAGSAPRRGIYVRVQRNNLDPLLTAFDFPEPFSTVGRRESTNVPAQSLMLLNDPAIAALAAAWAARVLADSSLPNDDARIDRMFREAFGRPATEEEQRRLRNYRRQWDEESRELAARRESLRNEVSAVRQRIADLLAPTRRRLAAALAEKAPVEREPPEPFARWEFENDLRDALGGAHGTAHGGARLEAGALVVDGRGYVLTEPLQRELKAKTLEAWVQLDTLEQRGGGVLTVQSRDGAVFDALVFGEREPRRWLAGSDFFRRTEPLGGLEEGEARRRPVHLALVYEADGMIHAYRDGVPHGKPYRSRGPAEFAAGESVVGFGIRHSPAGGNRLLRGRILRAQLYDRALTAEEVAASAGVAGVGVNEEEVRAALPAEVRAKIAAAEEALAVWEKELAELGPPPGPAEERVVWTDLARALFCFKEFIFVR